MGSIMHIKKYFAPGILLIILSSCTGNPTSIKIDGVEVSALNDHFVVLNQNNHSIYYNVWDRNLSVFAIWSPNPDNNIEPIQRKVFYYEEVSGYREGNKINFHYWFEKEFDPDLKKLIVIDTSEKKIEKIY